MSSGEPRPDPRWAQPDQPEPQRAQPEPQRAQPDQGQQSYQQQPYQQQPYPEQPQPFGQPSQPSWATHRSASMAPNTSPRAPAAAWGVDLGITIALFVLIAMSSGVAVVLGWVFGSLSQYGCNWESSTRACNPGMGWQTALAEGVVLLLVVAGGGLLAVRVRRTRPLGWAVALGTAVVGSIAVLLSIAVLRAVTS